ncbi:MAG: shikimate kinase [Actinomycetota bacterium]|nr:shikimate kinase [Actinomycetota bacterium]MDI6821389.1 shikimate kinase [Actinomycetota bacterium]
MKNIVLIGFMGSGKSSVGQRLAERLHYRFVDTDSLIEERAKRRIREIFEDSGEPVFRALEAKIIAEVSLGEGQIIACGGGAVLNPRNVEALKSKGILIYLKTALSAIYERVKNSGERPLLNVPQPKMQIEKLLSSREKIYEEVADLIVDTTGLSVEQVVQRIQRELGEKITS